MDELMTNLELPGFRFHPTEEELLGFYLKNVVFGKKMHLDIIGFLNIYRHDPWDLPELAKIGEREWYFFVPRDRKHGSGGRPNRITEHGFWKATGTDRKIFSLSDPKKMIGLKKTLVFYKGRAPRGCKSDWVMNEYRLPDNTSSLPKDIVLCKIYRKATSLKVLEQRAAEDELMKTTNHATPNSVSPLDNHPASMSMDSVSFTSSQDDFLNHHQHHLHHYFPGPESQLVFKKEAEEEVLVVEDEKHKHESSETSQGSSSSSSALQLPTGVGVLEDLQVPKFTMDWTQDSFWTQLRSPWLDNFTPTYAMF